MKQHRTMGKWRKLALAGAAALFLAVVGLAGLKILIDWAAAATGGRATRRFGGDKVEALVKLVACDGCAVTERNHAVWALGQIGDPRAMPALQKYYTGAKCDHQHALCQYELRKAIRKIDGTWGVLPYLRPARAGGSE